MRIARRDDLVRRIAAKIPRRETNRRQLGLAMPRRHEYHQPLYLAAFNRLQLLRDKFVVSCPAVKGIRVFSELQEALPRLPRRQHCFQALQFLQGGEEKLSL